MSTQEAAREAMAHQRQQVDHVQQAMLQRSQEEIAAASPDEIQAETREAMTVQRQQAEHVQASMLSRSAAEVGGSQDPS